ncbi:hypothetical protein EDD21DRAFT_220471 [Dissophora ornata]|nr:hypothetical protein EDD21DRAFT_220471 [Dissophora ornata]
MVVVLRAVMGKCRHNTRNFFSSMSCLSCTAGLLTMSRAFSFLARESCFSFSFSESSLAGWTGVVFVLVIFKGSLNSSLVSWTEMPSLEAMMCWGGREEGRIGINLGRTNARKGR